MRTCFIHIGTHKTATTSLQSILSNKSAAIQHQNYIYPRTGRPVDAPYGHHNIAWEISEDRRFRPEYGCTADLLAEILDSPCDVILSSEDFQCGVFSRNGFEAFVRLLRANQLAVRIIVYFRNQIDYAQSLYRTMLLFGIRDSFEEFLTRVLEDGRFCWQEWIFPFCYRSLLTRLEAIEGLTVDVRSYDKPTHGSVIHDYFSIFGLNPAALGIDSSVRLNLSGKLVESVRLFYQNATGSPLDPFERRSIDCLCESIGTKRLRISEVSALHIVERFRESNEYLRTRYGIETMKMDGAVSTVGGVDDTCLMETIFSADFNRRIDELASLLRQHHQVGV